MQITQTKNEKAVALYDITISANDVSEKVQTSLTDTAQKADIPGFRKGKVPLAIVEQRFGEKVYQDVVNTAIQDALEKIVKDDDLKLATQPKVDIKKATQKEDLEFSIECVLLPNIDLMDFSQLKIEEKKVSVSTEEVAEYIEQLAKEQRETVEVEKESATGSVVVLDFLGKVDGVAFEGGAGSDYNLELGSNSFIPGFEEQLVGLKAGDKKDVNVTFPEEYQAKELAGKDAVFECEIKAVKEYQTVEINDEFATKMGMDSLEQLQSRVEENLQNRFSGSLRPTVKKELMDQLVDGHTFEVADEMINAEFDAIWEQVLKSKENGTLEAEDAEKSEEVLKEEYQAIAERRVKLGVLLMDIAKEFAVEVKQEDVQNAVMAEARKYPGQEMQVFEYYQKNPKVLEQLHAPILEEKVIDTLLSKAETTITEVSKDEMEEFLKTA